MENHNVIQDAVRLASNILHSLRPDETWSIVNIAMVDMGVLKMEGYPSIRQVFGFKFDNTPSLLERNGVIEGITADWWYVGNSNINTTWGRIRPIEISIDDEISEIARKKGYLGKNEIVEYYFNISSGDKGPAKGGRATILVNKNSLEQFISKFDDKKSSPRYSRDHRYENAELHLIMQDGTDCTLDLSRAAVARSVFESFYYLFRDSNRDLFSREELLAQYKKLTKNDIDWRIFNKQKSSICGKMINPKPCLRNRIIWEFDRESGKYRFKILPLSDN